MNRSAGICGNHYDAVVIGSGHNGLVAAAYLAKAGKSVLVIEQNDYLGGATTSKQIFPDYDAKLSRYSYLVSLFPKKISQELGLTFQTRRRETASFTPYVDSQGVHRGLVMSNVDPERSRSSLLELCGREQDWNGYQRLIELESAIARVAWPSLLEPLRTKADFVSSLRSADEKMAWDYFIERPLGEAIERFLHHDVLRGLVMTDGKIGVLTHPHDESLQQNRCFLYHIIGGGTGEWLVPVGGMQALVDSLIQTCVKHGVQFLTRAQAQRVHPGKPCTVDFIHNDSTVQVDAGDVLVNAGPKTFHRLLGTAWKPTSNDEGCSVKINLLMSRLPKVKATGVSSREAFAGSFHIDEGYEQMKISYRKAKSGHVPDPAPGEVYCHTLTDPSILSPELQARGFHTLTLFGLDMPYRLFENDHESRREAVKNLFLEGLDRICDEPFIDCVAMDRDGQPCIEIRTPVDLESELGLDFGNIFHNSLSWFYADDSAESECDVLAVAGTWGVETQLAHVYRAGSSAHRGGAVSGVPGHNAAKYILERASS
jgi:phytoene dehydrogenase-like protein